MKFLHNTNISNTQYTLPGKLIMFLTIETSD